MGEKVITLTESNWNEEVLNSKIPVLVDFWAPWCGPCRIIAPIVEELAGKFEGRIKVGKLNTDEHPDIAGRYGIRAIPTLVLFKNGEVVDTRIGVQPREALEQMIMSHI